MSLDEGLEEFGNIIDELSGLSQDLTTIIEKQTEAVISADEEKIERYTQRYTELKGDFEAHEKKFARHLRELLLPAKGGDGEIKLERLKEFWPESKDRIEEWKTSLDQQLTTLKRKHEKLNSLLAFALNQNATMMRSLYGLHNQKNSLYGLSGSKEEISSGMAINKEA